MKKEYFRIELQINQLFKEEDPVQAVALVRVIKSSVKRHFIRFEVFHQPELYEEEIRLFKEKLLRAVMTCDFESAARLRSKIKYLELRVKKVDAIFLNQTPPICIINNHGLAKCLLHSKQHKRLHDILNCISWVKKEN